jgi:hypothetical protein
VTLVSHSDSNNKHAEAHSPGVKWKTIRAFVLGHGVPYIVMVRALERPSERNQNKGLIFEVQNGRRAVNHCVTRYGSGEDGSSDSGCRLSTIEM